jgi:hypothetical protein
MCLTKTSDAGNGNSEVHSNLRARLRKEQLQNRRFFLCIDATPTMNLTPTSCIWLKLRMCAKEQYVHTKFKECSFGLWQMVKGGGEGGGGGRGRSRRWWWRRKNSVLQNYVYGGI